MKLLAGDLRAAPRFADVSIFPVGFKGVDFTGNSIIGLLDLNYMESTGLDWFLPNMRPPMVFHQITYGRTPQLSKSS